MKSNMFSDLKFSSELLITDTSPQMGWQTLPKWIEFMIWAGWVMRSANSDSRQIMVLLLPERYCCSAFCSLGAILAGSTIPHNSLMWDEFLNFDKGARQTGSGNSFVAVADDVQTLFYNPGGLGQLQKINLSSIFDKDYRTANMRS